MTEHKSLAGQEFQPDEVTCSNCGTFVGALTKCPACGAPVRARMSIRFFRWASVLLATLGLFLLYLMATHRDIPVVLVGDIKKSMNFAYVTVEGVVLGEPRVYGEAGRIQSIRFSVDDGSGVMPVKVYGNKAASVADAGKVPREGDAVSVSGSLSVSAEDMVMYLQTPDHITIQSSDVELLSLGDVSMAMEGESALVEGTIKQVSIPPEDSKRPYEFHISDGTGTQLMIMWRSIYEAVPERGQLREGTRIEAYVTISSYRDKIQLIVNKPTDLQLLGE